MIKTILRIGDFIVDAESRVGIVVSIWDDPISEHMRCTYTLLRSGQSWNGPVRGMRLLESFDKFEAAWSRRTNEQHSQT